MRVSPVACLNPTCQQRRQTILVSARVSSDSSRAYSWNSVPHDFFVPPSPLTPHCLSREEWENGARPFIQPLTMEGGGREEGRKGGMGGSLS